MITTYNEKDTTETLELLQEKGDYYAKLCSIEIKKKADLEDALKHIYKQEETIKELSKKSSIDVLNLHVITPNPPYTKTNGFNVSSEAIHKTNKILEINETKLNKLLQKKSEIINNIKDIKHEINHFRRLRIQTDLQHSKFENNLLTMKGNIEKLLNESTEIVENRDNRLNDKLLLENENEKEQIQFEKEYEDMSNFIIQQNKILHDKLLLERKSDILERDSNIILHDIDVDNNKQGNLTLNEEIAMAKQIDTLTSFVSLEQNSLSNITEKINNFNIIFEQLKRLTNTTSMEDVISTYIAQEEEMFSLYNFIQSMNADIDTTLENTSLIDNEIINYKEKLLNDEMKRSLITNELQEKLNHINATNQTLENSYKISKESVNQLSKKISSLFFKLQCDQMDNLRSNTTTTSISTNNNTTNNNTSNKKSNLLANRTLVSNISLLTGQGISESNVQDYLCCIEQRANDIIDQYIKIMPNKYDIRTSAGPSYSPATRSIEPIIEFNDFNEDEYLAIDINKNEINEENDLKPIDLNLYKDKLQKQLGINNNKNNKEKNKNKLVNRSINNNTNSNTNSRK